MKTKMIRRLISPVLIVLLLAALCGCQKKAEEPMPTVTPTPTATATPKPTPTPTPSPTSTPEPEGIAVKVLPGKYGIVGASLKRGDEVEVIAEEDDMYHIIWQGEEYLVEKRFVRLSSEQAYEEHPAYTYASASLYESPYLCGAVMQTAQRNTEVKVLDFLGDGYLVELNGQQAYISASELSETMLPNYYYGGGDGGGEVTGADGGDIQLSAWITEPQIVLLSSAMQVKGMILADGVEAYIAIVMRGDVIKLTEEAGEESQIYVNGRYGVMPLRFLRPESEKDYEAWEAYAQRNAMAYKTWRVNGEAQALKVNEKLMIIDDLETCYLIEVNDELLYIAKDGVSETQVYIYYGGGSSGGSSGGDEWTAPML